MKDGEIIVSLLFFHDSTPPPKVKNIRNITVIDFVS